MLVCGDLQSGDCANLHGLHHLLHDLCPPLSVLRHLHRNGCFALPIPCDLPAVDDVAGSIHLGRAVDVDIVINRGKASPHSGLDSTKEGVFWQVGVVDLVQLLVRCCVLKLSHLGEVLETRILVAPESQHQLLVSQRADLEPGLFTRGVQRSVAASLEVLVFGKRMNPCHMLRDGQDHLYQELDVATAGSNAVPDLVFDTLDPDPGPQHY